MASHLNPQAPEFKPLSFTLPTSPYVHNTQLVCHLPVAPPVLSIPDTLFFFQPPPPPPSPSPPPPAMIYFFHHHHFLPPFQVVPPSPQSDLRLPLADDGLGLITSPTSPTSPFELHQPSSTTHPRKPMYSKSAPKNNSGRVPGRGFRSQNFLWVKKSEIPDEGRPLPDRVQDHATVFEAQMGPAPGPVPLSTYPFGDCTSLMIRNIPVRLSRRELLELLDAHCREENEKRRSDSDAISAFDFLYLPIDFKMKGNLGYAFVNFTNWEGASRLYNCWSGSNWGSCSYNSTKICQIDQAKFQGRELKKHCERSLFVCESDEYLPVGISPPRDGFNARVTRLTTLGRRVVQLLKAKKSVV
ncbi:protein MEI2-like 7 [Spinacia oleracea]|uniref:Protein MEI2-like 7 n=1 Tax=Spinacia oleracea TaxID=3562 RepID=A0ABM3RE71_SPIOL|nr:protein MEI2-like 7 [Spinacia oleracea]